MTILRNITHKVYKKAECFAHTTQASIKEQGYKKTFENGKNYIQSRLGISDDTKTSMNEIAGFSLVAMALAAGFYNPDIAKIDTYEHKIVKHNNDFIEKTIPAQFLKKSTNQVRKDILGELEEIIKVQSKVNDARLVTSQLSPAFTLVPLLANSAFMTTLALSLGDVITVEGLVRIKKKIEMRPEIIPPNKTSDYEKKMAMLSLHMQTEMQYDLAKVFYRGLIVKVNKKLAENEQPKEIYATDAFKKLSKNRYIPLKNNLGVVSLVLPTSYIYSKMGAAHTKEFKRNLSDFHLFVKDIVEDPKNFEEPHRETPEISEKTLLEKINKLGLVKHKKSQDTSTTNTDEKY